MENNPNVFIWKENFFQQKVLIMIAHAQHTAPQLPHLICIQEEEEKISKWEISTGRLLKSSSRAQIQSAECSGLSFTTRKWQTMKHLPGLFPHSGCSWTLSHLKNYQSVHFSLSVHRETMLADQSPDELHVGAFCPKPLFNLEGHWKSFAIQHGYLH